jgi:hypothetical protein
MTIKASFAGTHIGISGTTNLPDGARVELFAGRAFRQLHGDVRMADGGLAGFAMAVVNSGRFNGTIPVVKHPLDPLGLLPEQGPVAVVDPDVTACAHFQTGRKGLGNSGPWYQPDPAVRAEVGSFGGRLRGSPHVGVFGSLTKYPSRYLEVSTHARVPTSGILQQIGGLQSQAPAVEPLAGFCYF